MTLLLHDDMARQEAPDEWPTGTRQASGSSLSAAASEGPSSSRRMSRSPHPYHRRGAQLAKTPDVAPDGGFTEHLAPPPPTTTRKQMPRPSSDSGTEADDEGPGLLRGLPAPHSSTYSRLLLRDQDSEAEFTARKPPARVYKRGANEVMVDADAGAEGARDARVKKKRKLEVLRRVFETALILGVGSVVFLRDEVRDVARMWDKEIIASCALVITLYGLLPLRIYSPGFHLPSWGNAATLPFSPNFDPAPLMYPVLLPALVALSLGWECRRFVLPNLVLSLSSLPSLVVPGGNILHGYGVVHWTITAIPLIISELPIYNYHFLKPLFLLDLDREALILIFPLQQALVSILHFLTTTSLLPTEVQLLASGLINLLLFSASPQAEILKALLCVGGALILVSCSHVLSWGVTLARVPSWKFRRPASDPDRSQHLLKSLDRRLCQKLNSSVSGEPLSDSDSQPIGPSMRRVSSHGHKVPAPGAKRDMVNVQCENKRAQNPITDINACETSGLPADIMLKKQSVAEQKQSHSPEDAVTRPKTTPRGRLKRSVEPSLRSFLSLTLAQAKVRKWAYATYVYVAILLIILAPVRRYVSESALQSHEPIGWAVGYFFGNIPSLRFWLVRNNLDGWACIPPWNYASSCHLGWVEHLRRDGFGEANTRLIISTYYLLVLFVGMALVFRLSMVVGVDTRRKVFHGMMAMMFLPATYIDPAFSALALGLMLAVFLLLDLFRASQLPPISKPLTHFLSPYADGRDHCGPVIVSHMFLLIGCAIPLWLSLAGARHSGTPPWEGWEIESRDVSMVSGVVCVGMGDAAASLVGRRYGRRKWFWGGGKSIEGSVAFAVAVMLGLVGARLWLDIGGWNPTGPVPASHHAASASRLGPAPPPGGSAGAWAVTIGKSALAATGSSLMEAVLTGGNDNVVVPLVLWLLVRGLDI